MGDGVLAGLFDLRGNYVNLHENLLDLTHAFVYSRAEFWHTGLCAGAPTKWSQRRAFSDHPQCCTDPAPAGLAQPTGCTTTTRLALATFKSSVAPGVDRGQRCVYYDSHLAELDRQTYESGHARANSSGQGSTHYFYRSQPRFRARGRGRHAFMREQLMIAFTEDVVALTLLEEADRGA